eukprot:Platyproteum_vivax@DN2521_c0_g1_i1.p1
MTVLKHKVASQFVFRNCVYDVEGLPKSLLQILEILVGHQVLPAGSTIDSMLKTLSICASVKNTVLQIENDVDLHKVLAWDKFTTFFVSELGTNDDSPLQQEHYHWCANGRCPLKRVFSGWAVCWIVIGAVMCHLVFKKLWHPKVTSLTIAPMCKEPDSTAVWLKHQLRECQEDQLQRAENNRLLKDDVNHEHEKQELRSLCAHKLSDVQQVYSSELSVEKQLRMKLMTQLETLQKDYSSAQHELLSLRNSIEKIKSEKEDVSAKLATVEDKSKKLKETRKSYLKCTDSLNLLKQQKKDRLWEGLNNDLTMTIEECQHTFKLCVDSTKNSMGKMLKLGDDYVHRLKDRMLNAFQGQ